MTTKIMTVTAAEALNAVANTGPNGGLGRASFSLLVQHEDSHRAPSSASTKPQSQKSRQEAVGLEPAATCSTHREGSGLAGLSLSACWAVASNFLCRCHGTRQVLLTSENRPLEAESVVFRFKLQSPVWETSFGGRECSPQGLLGPLGSRAWDAADSRLR